MTLKKMTRNYAHDAMMWSGTRKAPCWKRNGGYRSLAQMQNAKKVAIFVLT
jgi:hypothetical protein